MWAAIIGAIIAAVSAVASGVSSYRNIKQTNEQNQANYEDWKSYNSPSEQMSRFSEAGLNPYMVNGVSNTLSQPFSVSQNMGISSLFSQLSSAAAHGVSGLNSAESNEIGRMNADTKKRQLELNEIGMELRKKMTDVNIKKGDAMAALLWSQGSIADLNASFWRDMSDVRRNKYISDATISAQNADFLSGYNPMRLAYYSSFFPGMLENLSARTGLTRRQTSHLDWSEKFNEYKFAQQMELAWQKYFFNRDAWKFGFDLKHDYYDLALRKFTLDKFLAANRIGDTWFDNAMSYWSNMFKLFPFFK